MRARHTNKTGRDADMEERMIAHQRAECERIARQLHATVIREYVEYGGTGSIAKRPQLRLMLDELLALHDVTYVITEKPDRIARQTNDLRTVHLELEASGATLVTVSGNTTINER